MSRSPKRNPPTEVHDLPTHYVDYILTRIPRIFSFTTSIDNDTVLKSSDKGQNVEFMSQTMETAGAIASTLKAASTATVKGDTSTTIATVTTGAAPDIPALSISILASSLLKINSKTKTLAVVHKYLTEFFSWENPALTLSLLIVYTYICFRPYLVVGIPGCIFLYGIMAPGFAHRHPLPRQLLPRARSPINEYDDMLYEKWPVHHVYDNYIAAEAKTSSSTNTSSTKGTADNYDPLTDDSMFRLRLPMAKAYLPRKDVLTSVKELQYGLSKFAESLDKVEEFYFGPASFVGDESMGAAIFIMVLLGTIGAVFAASFLSLSVAAAVGGWAVVLLAHPDIKRNVHQIQEEYLSGQEEALEELVAKFQEANISSYEESCGSITEFPEEDRDVEVFELQRQGLTPRLWDAWVFTPMIYSERSAYRLAENRPPGSTFLEEVQPPPGWFFRDSDPWTLDTNTKGWVMNRACRNVEIDVDDHWAYDYKNGERGEWRRRRWIRRCFRGPLPPRTKESM